MITQTPERILLSRVVKRENDELEKSPGNPDEKFRKIAFSRCPGAVTKLQIFPAVEREKYLGNKRRFPTTESKIARAYSKCAYLGHLASLTRDDKSTDTVQPPRQIWLFD